MAGFLNLSFEDPKVGGLVTLAGNEFEPSSWTLVEFYSAIEVADYTDAVRLGTETFERTWLGNEDFVFEFVGFPFDLEPVTFNSPGPNPSIVEDFERLWSGPFEFREELSRLEVASFRTRTTPVEVSNFDGFEGAWSNDDFAFDPSDASFSAASFTVDGGVSAFEGFESEWSNTDFASEFAPSDLASAIFTLPNAGTANVETFEESRERLILLDIANDAGSLALWQIIVNGEAAEYRAGASDGAVDIANALIQRVNNLSVGAIAARDGDHGNDQFAIRAASRPSDLVIEVNLRDQRTGDSFVRTPFDVLGYWSQVGYLGIEV